AVCWLSLLETPLLASVLMIIIGGSTALFTPIVWALLQEMTPAHLLGRVFTTFSTGSMSSAMAGMAGFGWAADRVGAAASLIGIGLRMNVARDANSTKEEPMSNPTQRRAVHRTSLRHGPAGWGSN